MQEFESRFNSNNNTLLNEDLNTPKMNPLSMENSSQKDHPRKVDVILNPPPTNHLGTLIPIREESLINNYSQFLASDINNPRSDSLLDENYQS
jgi:hypothetical protein